MHTFAIYRLPFATECTMLIQHSAPLVLSSLTELEGKKGFVIAPFNVSDKCPILLLQPNEVRTMPIKQVQSKPKEKQMQARTKSTVCNTTETSLPFTKN